MFVYIMYLCCVCRGIVLPDSAKPKYNQFKVVATGQGLRKRDGEFAPLSVKTGDTVIVGDAYGAQELTFDNETYHLYREDDVLGELLLCVCVFCFSWY